MTVALCWACDDDSGLEPLPAGTFDLTDPNAWQVLAASEDPVERAPGVLCRENGYGAERLSFTADRAFDAGESEECHRVAHRQPNRKAQWPARVTQPRVTTPFRDLARALLRGGVDRTRRYLGLAQK